MKLLAQVLICLYPAAWRERYREELLATLEDAGWKWRDLWSVLTSGIGLRMREKDFAICVGGCAALGLTIAIGFAAVMPGRYRASLEFRGIPPNPSILSRTELARIISRHNLYARELKHWPLEDVIDEMRQSDIHLTRSVFQHFQLSYQNEIR